MVFVTTGTQLPFDRLMKAVDKIAEIYSDKEFVVQCYPDHYQPKNFKAIDFISPADFHSYVSGAELIISHAGVGTILSAAELEQPLIVFPRFGSLKEHRNDHQIATCNSLKKIYNLNIAMNSQELVQLFGQYIQGKLEPMKKISQTASGALITSIQQFINEESYLRPAASELSSVFSN